MFSDVLGFVMMYKSGWPVFIQHKLKVLTSLVMCFFFFFLVCILQESSDSSNTTVEDEDVKGKAARTQKRFQMADFRAQESWHWDLNKFWTVARHFHRTDRYCSQLVKLQTLVVGAFLHRDGTVTRNKYVKENRKANVRLFLRWLLDFLQDVTK